MVHTWQTQKTPQPICHQEKSSEGAVGTVLVGWSFVVLNVEVDTGHSAVCRAPRRILSHRHFAGSGGLPPQLSNEGPQKLSQKCIRALC